MSTLFSPACLRMNSVNYFGVDSSGSSPIEDSYARDLQIILERQGLTFLLGALLVKISKIVDLQAPNVSHTVAAL